MLTGPLGLLATGVALGLGAAVPPGPVNLEIARRSAAGGFGRGAAVGLGAVTVDVVLAALLTNGVLAAMNALRPLRLAVSAAGVVLLIWLGTLALRSFRRRLRERRGEAMPPAASPRGGYLTGLLLCSTSPYQAAFWLTAVPSVLGKTGGTLLVCAGVFAATLAWVAAFAGATAWLGGRLGWRLAAGMDLAGGATLLAFALVAAANLFRAAA